MEAGFRRAKRLRDAIGDSFTMDFTTLAVNAARTSTDLSGWMVEDE
ncbi:hypothetical protein [Nocardia australiensis]|nr:hypothetical protein [Nocardia australiensis]